MTFPRMKGWMVQWYRKVPFRANLIVAALPGLIRPVVKLPPRVAVWVAPSALTKVTRVPLATRSVAGLYAKPAILTLAVRLAVAP